MNRENKHGELQIISHDFRENQYTEVLSPQNEGIAKCKNPTAEKRGMELGVSRATVERAETQKTMGQIHFPIVFCVLTI